MKELVKYFPEEVVSLSVEIFENELDELLEVTICYNLINNPYCEHLIKCFDYDEVENAWFYAKMLEFKLINKYGNDKVYYDSLVNNHYDIEEDLLTWDDIECLEWG